MTPSRTVSQQLLLRDAGVQTGTVEILNHRALAHQVTVAQRGGGRPDRVDRVHRGLPTWLDVLPELACTALPTAETRSVLDRFRFLPELRLQAAEIVTAHHHQMEAVRVQLSHLDIAQAP